MRRIIAPPYSDGKAGHEIEARIPPGILHEGENAFQIENVGDTGAAYSVVFLDRYALSYPRLLVAEADHSYLAVSPEAVLRPELRPASPATLASPDNGADYLLLAPLEFLGLDSAVSLWRNAGPRG